MNNPNPDVDGFFGGAIGVSGRLAVIGAYGENLPGKPQAGMAYVCNLATGGIVSKLYQPSPTAYSHFGYSAAIAGRRVVVGTVPGYTSAGTALAAYVFQASTGNILAILSNPEPANGDGFGASVAISEDLALAGAYRYGCGVICDGPGRVYVFDAGTGALVATLLNPEPDGGDYFGESVAISGRLAVVGAPGDDSGGFDGAGTAYVFDASTGALVATLNNPAPGGSVDQLGKDFGYAVAISGNLAVVGAWRDDPGGIRDAGTAYVFEATTGMLRATLKNPAPTASDAFGHSVAIFGNTALVGAYQDDPSTPVVNGGSAYAFDAFTGTLEAILTSPMGSEGAHFGDSVAISGGSVIVATRSGSPGGIDRAGIAFVFGCGDRTLTPISAPNSASDWALYE